MVFGFWFSFCCNCWCYLVTRSRTLLLTSILEEVLSPRLERFFFLHAEITSSPHSTSFAINFFALPVSLCTSLPLPDLFLARPSATWRTQHHLSSPSTGYHSVCAHLSPTGCPFPGSPSRLSSRMRTHLPKAPRPSLRSSSPS